MAQPVYNKVEATAKAQIDIPAWYVEDHYLCRVYKTESVVFESIKLTCHWWASAFWQLWRYRKCVFIQVSGEFLSHAAIGVLKFLFTEAETVD